MLMDLPGSPATDTTPFDWHGLPVERLLRNPGTSEVPQGRMSWPERGRHVERPRPHGDRRGQWFTQGRTDVAVGCNPRKRYIDCPHGLPIRHGRGVEGTHRATRSVRVPHSEVVQALDADGRPDLRGREDDGPGPEGFRARAGRERRDDARDRGPLDRDARDGHCRLHENLARARISVIGGSPLVHRFRVAPLTRGGPLATYDPIRGDRDAYGEDSDVYGRARAKERRDREQPR